MAQSTISDLKDYPSNYASSRDVGNVLIGEDAARLLMEASSSGDDKGLQSLLSQPQWIKTMLEEPHCIYHRNQPSQGPNDVQQVSAMRTSNVERALTMAVEKGHTSVISTLLEFATQQGMDSSDVITSSIIRKTIRNGQPAVLKVLASADPNIINFPLGHGVLPLYEALKEREPEVVAMLLELGADPLHPVEQSKELKSYNSSVMSLAALSQGPRMTEILLKHGMTIAQTGALHTAASSGRFDTMQSLIQHGAEVDEPLSDWRNWTPMHFAAWRGRADAMKWLEDNGARSDLKDAEGRTPAQVLEERNTA